MQAWVKRNISRMGSALTLAGLLYVAMRLADYWPQLDFAALSGTVLWPIPLLSLAYGLVQVLLALAWHSLLCQLGQDASRLRTVSIYGRSQIAKYAPGNVFHLTGRQAIGMAEGFAAEPLAKSLGAELALLVLVGSLLVGGLLHRWLSDVLGMPVMVLLLSLVSAVAWGLFRQRCTLVGQAMLLQALFLLSAAAVYWVLLSVLVPAETLMKLPSGLVLGSAIAAWLIGLLTPGAPAGLGVREGVLLYFLRTWLPQADVLLTVILVRLINMSGDLLFFFLGLLMQRILQNSAQTRLPAG
jgi:glycosyltransferase 2 family protein